ncbi:MAG: hypothetical protein MI922_10275, partial [Bacteroidales bacterium]|nr:hypothetical protein [Bacteroidales bacterium]
MKKGTCLILSLICLLIANITFAQKSYNPEFQDPLLEPWRWKHFPGITKYGVQDMIEDDDGIMWFGVKNGLLSYNGYSWTEHNTPKGFSFGIIFDLAEHQNKVYVAAKFGAYYFDKAKNEWHRIIKTDLPSKVMKLLIHNIQIDQRNGNVYLATNSGLFYYNNDQLYFYASGQNKAIIDTTFPEVKTVSFPGKLLRRGDFSTRYTVQAPNGDIVIINKSTKGGGVLKVTETGNLEDPLKFSINKKNKGGISISTRSAASYIDGNELWILCRLTDKKVSVLKDDQWSQFSVCEQFGDRDIYSGIEQMDNGNVILAGEGQIYVRGNNEWKRYQSPDIPVTSTGYIIMRKTRNGDLWIGGEGNDIYFVQYSDQRWKTYKDLFYQFTDNENSQWFLSSDNKVVFQKGESWFSYGKDDGLIDAPTKMVMAKNDVIWCTGSEKGLSAACYLHNNKWHKMVFDTLSKSVEQRSVFVDKDGSIFLGSKIGANIKGGVVRISYDNIESVKIEHWTENVQSSVTGGILRDKKDRLLVLNLNSVIHLDEEGNIEYLKGVVRGKSSTSTTAPNGDLWIGTENMGLYTWNGDKSEQIDAGNGLLSNVVTNICVEGERSVWVATEKDITHYDGETWINNVFSGQFIIEKEAGDLKSDKNGGLWINMVPRKWMMRSFYPDIEHDFTEGFYSVRYQPDTTPPQCTFEFYTKEVDPVGNSHITWNGIDYMNETDGNNLLFSYKLNDQNWTPFTEGNDKTFLSLARGKYTLKLKAKDRLGNTSLLSDQVFFIVQPPIYLRPWFLIMISVFLVIIGYLIRRIIKKNHDLMAFNVELKEQKEEIQAQNE